MPTIRAQSPDPINVPSNLDHIDCGFHPFPSFTTRSHLINLTKSLLDTTNGLNINAPFKDKMIENGFALVVNDNWRAEANHHPIHPTNRLTGLEFVALGEQIPPLKSEVFRVSKDEIKQYQNGIKIYYDLEAIKKIYPNYDNDLFLQALSSMMRAKKGDNIDSKEEEALKKISPHILFRFESKQIFEYYKDQSGQEEIKILDPKNDKRAQNRPFYFNFTPQLTRGAPDFQYFTDKDAFLVQDKKSQLEEKYKSMAKLQLYVSAKNNEGCFFLEPGAFLHGLSQADQGEAKKMWLKGVFDAITEFENRPDKLGKNLGRVFVQSSFLPKDIQRDEKKIKHLQVYFSDGLDCAKTHAKLGSGLSVAQPVMGHATHAIGNGALSDGAEKAAEENLYRQMAGLMAVAMGPQNNKKLLDYNWLASRSEDISTGLSANPTQVAMGGGNNSSQNPRGVGGAGVGGGGGGGDSRASARRGVPPANHTGHKPVQTMPTAPQTPGAQEPATSPQQPLSANPSKNNCCVIS